MDTYTNISEALVAFGLNFEVEKSALSTFLPDVETGELTEHIVPDNFTTYRKDTNDILGIVGSRYEIVQNADQFGVFQNFADEGLISFEKGGIFGNGRRTYIQAVLPNCIEINADRGDIIKKYVTIVNSHDGTISLQAFVTDIRIICHNTFMAAIRTGAHKSKIKHTKTANNRLSDAINIIHAALEQHNEMDEFILAANGSREFSQKETEKFVELVLPEKGSELSTRKENQRIELLNTIHTGIGQDVIDKNNLYKLFNGVTCWTNNVLAGKKENSLEYLTYQTGQAINADAFNVCLKILKNDLILS